MLTHLSCLLSLVSAPPPACHCGSPSHLNITAEWNNRVKAKWIQDARQSPIDEKRIFHKIWGSLESGNHWQSRKSWDSVRKSKMWRLSLTGDWWQEKERSGFLDRLQSNLFYLGFSTLGSWIWNFGFLTIVRFLLGFAEKNNKVGGAGSSLYLFAWFGICWPEWWYSAWFLNFDFLFLFVDQALLTGALAVQHCEHCGGLLNAALLFLGLLPGPCSARAMAIPTVNSSPWKVGWPNMKTAYSGPQSLGRLTNIKTKVEILDIWKYLKSMQSGPRTHRPTRPWNSVATDLNTHWHWTGRGILKLTLYSTKKSSCMPFAYFMHKITISTIKSFFQRDWCQRF